MENKHASYDLAQMQSLPLNAKIIMTQHRIRQWYEHYEGQVYVSFSGGKDSTVLKHIVDEMYDDVPSVFVNTGLEYPELQHFVRSIKGGKYDCFNSNVEIIRPEMRFDEVIKKHGYPVISKEVSLKIKETRSKPDGYASQSFEPNSEKVKRYGARYDLSKYKYLLDAPFKISNVCCDVMKKKPAKQYEKGTGRKAFIGTMASESVARKTQWLRHGCNAFEKNRPTSQPMSFWTEQDILHYIKEYNVPYASVYGDIVPTSDEEQIEGQITAFDVLQDYDETPLKTTGCNRTGCIFCMFGCHLEKEPNRFQRLKLTHPKQYEYCIGGGEMVDGKWQPNEQGLGLGKVLDYIGVNY